jgi:hypothetical protein
MNTTSPVVRWTPAEAWLMVEFARRALVATIDGEALRSVVAGDAGRFHVELEEGDDVALALRFDAEHVLLALDPAVAALRRRGLGAV